MAGALDRLLVMVRDPLEAIYNAAKANPQRMVRDNPQAVTNMAQRFAAHVAEDNPDVEHFTYRPLWRLPSEDHPYFPYLESTTSGRATSVRPQDSFWELAQRGQPNVSFHNHPGSHPTLPSYLGNSASQGGGDLAVLDRSPFDSMMGIINRPTLRGGMRDATVLTNKGALPNDQFMRAYGLMEANPSVLREAMGPDFPDEFRYLDATRGSINQPLQKTRMRRTGDLKLLDLIDQGRLRLDTSEAPDAVLPFTPRGTISNAGASPEEVRDLVNWHSGILAQLRKSGFMAPPLAAPGLIDRLRSPQPEAQ